MAAHKAAQQSGPSRIWSQLLPELAEHVVSFLTPNEVACTVRLINKASAEHFSGPHYTTVRLSQPAPAHAFRQRWGSPGAMGGLTLKQRQQLICLTARSGSIPNLEFISTSSGWCINEVVFEAAASAGQLEACRWLREYGCPFRHALREAARAGHRAVCEWLLANGCSWDSNAVLFAAREGHPDLMDWLLQRRPESSDRPDSSELLEEAARGCDLPTLQRLQRLANGLSVQVPWLGSAAGSTTPDWQAKVEWLEALGCPKSADTCAAVVTCPDAVGRLAWLWQRDYPVDSDVANAAVEAGAVEVLQCLLAEGVWPDDSYNYLLAAQQGDLDTLTLLHSHGYGFEGDRHEVMRFAALGGQLHVVAWLVETLGAAELLQAEFFNVAASTGNLALLNWLRERGCPWDERTFGEAVAAGNEEALEWLVEQGCPMPEDGTPYNHAACTGDLAMLRCLRRLGCPWGPVGKTFTDCIRCCDPMAVCRLLLEEGCPVDWQQAVKAAKVAKREDVVRWLREQKGQQAARGGGGGGGV